MKHQNKRFDLHALDPVPTISVCSWGCYGENPAWIVAKLQLDSLPGMSICMMATERFRVANFNAVAHLGFLYPEGPNTVLLRSQAPKP